MDGWTSDRALQLAPDAASAKAGQSLAAARHWVSLGSADIFLWGECQGSGAKPYQVRIDLSEPAFKCSCPSRKFPCKHAIGLMLLFAANAVATATRPAWVEEWAKERESRAEKKREKADAPSKPVDAAAQQKRQENRFERIGDGLAALKLWLHDLARGGIASAPTRGYAFFDDQARRLIDAQAPGVARRVNALASVASTGAGWETPFLKRIAALHLLISGFERLESLPESAKEVVLNAIGIARAQEDILTRPAMTDRWQIIAQEVTQEDRLRAQRTWLLGQQSGTIVMVLAFAHGTQSLDTTLLPGFAFTGEICLYPGDGLRGVIKERGTLAPLNSIKAGGDIDALHDRYSAALALNPWLDSIAFPLMAVVPVRHGDVWAIIDGNGKACSLSVNDMDGWTMIALAGGKAIDVVVHFDGEQARPLAVMANGEYFRLGQALEVATS